MALTSEQKARMQLKQQALRNEAHTLYQLWDAGNFDRLFERLEVQDLDDLAAVVSLLIYEMMTSGKPHAKAIDELAVFCQAALDRVWF